MKSTLTTRVAEVAPGPTRMTVFLGSTPGTSSPDMRGQPVHGRYGCDRVVGAGLGIGTLVSLAGLGAGEADFGGDFGEGRDDEGDVRVEVDAELGGAAIDIVAIDG